jgi:hypothetical protein
MTRYTITTNMRISTAPKPIITSISCVTPMDGGCIEVSHATKRQSNPRTRATNAPLKSDFAKCLSCSRSYLVNTHSPIAEIVPESEAANHLRLAQVRGFDNLRPRLFRVKPALARFVDYLQLGQLAPLPFGSDSCPKVNQQATPDKCSSMSKTLQSPRDRQMYIQI